jgi:hypothetical protein
VDEKIMGMNGRTIVGVIFMAITKLESHPQVYPTT